MIAPADRRRLAGRSPEAPRSGFHTAPRRRGEPRPETRPNPGPEIDGQTRWGGRERKVPVGAFGWGLAPPIQAFTFASWALLRGSLGISQSVAALVEIEDLSSVGELRETACTRLGLRWENLGQLSVAWPRSLRIQVDRQSDMARNRARMTLQAICPASALECLEGRNAFVESNGESLGPMYEGTVARLLSRPLRGGDRTIAPSAIKAEFDPSRHRRAEIPQRGNLQP